MPPNMMIAAIHAAADFGDVIPLSADRKPLVPFSSATADAEQIEKLWSKWPDAGVGLCAWAAGLLVIDVEHERKAGADGYATVDRLEREIGPLPPTRVHATKSGGEHRVYALDRGVILRSAQGVIRRTGASARGVDIVTGRSVLRWPPTPGYTIKRPGEGVSMDGGGFCAPLPPAWIEALSDPPPEPPKPVYVESESDGRVYALAALAGEVKELAALAAGRNCALTKSAYVLGQLSPPLQPSEIEQMLLGACEINGSLKEHGLRACTATILRGVRAGQSNPRRVTLR